ncbi:asparagine synthase-related protein [Streptomyces flavofungini]|uniref:asparagine synthase-related protein n=1 Tax=Streptomyces flavofungini TaxID=68200 RepID=UPI0025AF65FF|nr:asparagine synthase-related protein [Streptomyces flavofungini]WJV51730.1 asparagine synthase-related protein [Streptomyces flavofungini]
MTEAAGAYRPPWFCVLPDDDAAGPLARRLSGQEAARTFKHTSGRPWLIASGWGKQLRTATAGPLKAVLIGSCPVSTARLRDLATRAAGTGQDEELAALPGSYYLITARRGVRSARGDVAGLNRLYYACVEGGWVLSNSPQHLADAAGTGVDRRWAALRLLAPSAPSPLVFSRSPYQGVTPIPPGSKAVLSPSRPVAVTRYWTPPEPVLPLDAGAERLREALARAVAARVASPPVASVQLSGGLDSAALAALAARARPTATTVLVTIGSRAADNPDERWARRTAGLLEGVDHLVLDPGSYPRIFQDLQSSQFALAEPAPFAASAARFRHTLRVLAERGSSAHLNGQGGDEALLAPLSYLPRAAARSVHRAWWHLRGHAALNRTSSLSLARAAATAGTYRQWLIRGADQLIAPASPAAALAGWEAPPRLPPWTAPEVIRDLRQELRAAAEAAEPVCGDIATHGTVARIRSVARRASLYRDAMHAAGVPGHFPYLDRSVIETALATLPEERTDPWAPKPLLTAAVTPLAPPGLLIRRDKGHYNHEIWTGLAAHHGELAELFHGSALSQAGLIDEKALRQHLAEAATRRLAPAFITETVALELWLRAARP